MYTFFVYFFTFRFSTLFNFITNSIKVVSLFFSTYYSNIMTIHSWIESTFEHDPQFFSLLSNFLVHKWICLHLEYCTHAIITCGLYIFKPLFEGQKRSRSFFHKSLPLCMVSIQERFIIKSGLWWRAYGIYFTTL